MIDDSMGEAIRAGERARLRALIVALKQDAGDCAFPACSHCIHNAAIDKAVLIIDHPAPETRT